jgi:hypothetical protein
MFDRSQLRAASLAVASAALALGASACGSSQAPATGTVITQTVPTPVAQARTAPPPATTDRARQDPAPVDEMRTATAPAAPAVVEPESGRGSAGGEVAATYVREAQAICHDVNDRLGALGQGSDFAASTERSITITRDGAQRLRALDVPPSAADDHGRFVALLEQQTGALEALRQAFVARDDAALRVAAQKSQAASALQASYARRLGLSACAGATSRGG